MRGKYTRRRRARLRRERRDEVAIQAAVVEAARLKRSKKRGCSSFDRNMLALGFRRVSGSGESASEFEES